MAFGLLSRYMARALLHASLATGAALGIEPEIPSDLLPDGAIMLGQIVDLRHYLPNSGEYPYRDPRDVTTLVIHHTATYGWSWLRIAELHVLTKLWKAIGYTWGVSYDGKAWLLHDIDRKTNHVRGHNSKYVGLAMLGHYQERDPSPEMIRTAESMIRYLMEVYPNLCEIVYHGEVVATLCPGEKVIVWLVDFRERLKIDGIIARTVAPSWRSDPGPEQCTRSLMCAPLPAVWLS